MTPELVRAEGYRILGACFGYPDPERLLEELRGAEAAPAPVSELASLAYLVDDDVAGEHNRLFAQTVVVPPYETSYMRADKGSRLGQLAALYDAFGARTGGEERENADHVGTELEFAALVCLKEALAAHARDEERTAIARDVHGVFAREHLGRWIPAFAERLHASTTHPFYQHASRLLAAWVARDLDEHGWSADPLDGPLPPEDDACLACPMAPKDT
ncbi:MAG: TorD/DmsD family molecular chaperone [Myxococcota bacterium]